MATKQRTTVVGVFSDNQSADSAVVDLRKAGFRNDQISFVGRHVSAETLVKGKTANEENTYDTYAEEGAVAGVLAGAGLGGLVALGVVSSIIPVIGPAVAAGGLGVFLSNVAGVAAIGGMAGALIGAGIDEEEARYYHKKLEAGHAIVTVTAKGRADEANAILRRHGAHDMHT
ncbi:MAG: general stress protein, partial [Isosphaeraceae bacterium]